MTRNQDLRRRTLTFAVATFKFCRTLRRSEETWDIVRQLRRAASAVAANYRSTQRAQSDAAFASKTALVIEEADEADFWLEFLTETELSTAAAVAALRQEATELVAIFTASKKKVCARIAAQRAARKRKSPKSNV